MNKEVVLLQPPFFRYAGSHNDRIPMELAYASDYLEEFDVHHVVLNADATGSRTYIKWSEMFYNFPYFMDAVDGRSALYSEILEVVMSYKPGLVVIAAGDSLMPDVDWGHYQIAANFSGLFRRYHVPTLGVGKFVVAYPERFGKDYDGFVTGPAMFGFYDAVVGMLRGGKGNWPTRFGRLHGLPNFSHLRPMGLEENYIFTSFGCPYSCAFCYRSMIYKGQHLLVPPEIFAMDVSNRSKRELTIRDGTIATEPDRIKRLALALRTNLPPLDDYSFSCDLRADLISEEMIVALQDMNVTRLKMGLECLDDDALQRMNKRETVDQITSAFKMVKDAGFELSIYMIIGAGYGDRQAWARTIDYVEELAPHSLVINTAAYLDFDDPLAKYDTHWSPISAKRYGVDEDILWRLLRLQDKYANPTVQIF